MYARAGKALFDEAKASGEVSLLDAKKIMSKNLASMKVVDAAVKLGLFELKGQNVSIVNGYNAEDVAQKLKTHFTTSKDKRPMTVRKNKKNKIKATSKKATAKKRSKKIVAGKHAPVKTIKPLRDITVKSYAKAIKTLRKLKRPTLMSAQQFAKKFAVSTNLIIGLVDKKYLKRIKDGSKTKFQWVGTQTMSADTVARRVLSYLNSQLYVQSHQQPVPKAVAKAAAKKNPAKAARKTVAANKPKPIADKSNKPNRPAPKRERAEMSKDTGIRLAERWSQLGKYENALAVLDQIAE